NKSNVCIAILTVTTLLHPLWCYLFITKLKMDLYGAGYSLIVSQALNMVIISLYIHFFNPQKETYFCINKDCLKGWMEYLKFTLPSAFMIIADSMAYELQAVIAIFMTKQDYALHIFVSNIANILFTLTHGFGMAATVLI